MLVITGSARFHADDIDALREAAQHMVAESRKETGCIAYAYAFDLFDPTLMHIVEKWDDRAALSRHFETTHMRTWRAALGRLRFSDLELFTVEGEQHVLPR
ncbi:MAG: putative quinol monooxygenase [Pseudomonadota bacterium]